MSDLIVACVRTGAKFDLDYVERLKRGVAKHLPVKHRFVCLTDRNSVSKNGIEFISIDTDGLPKWWPKLRLFERGWRGDARVVYLDLDSVIVGDLTPLTQIERDFAICFNFTKAHGHPTWPCSYGSCCMVIGPNLGDEWWKQFERDRVALMAKYERYGDQRVIEQFAPGMPYLQDLLPPGFFVGYRDFGDITARKQGHVLVFGGGRKPHNTPHTWIKDAWIGKTP